MSVLRPALRPLARQALARSYATVSRPGVVEGFVGAVGNTPLVSMVHGQGRDTELPRHPGRSNC